MAAYRYLLSSVPTGTLIAELPFESATYDHVLNAPGSFGGTLGLKQPAKLASVLAPLLSPQTNSLGKLGLYVERDGVIVWGGLLWTARADLDAGTYELAGEGWLSYFRHRVMRESFSYPATDQTSIAKNLMNNHQVWSGGGTLGISIADVQPSGVLRDRFYLASERKEVGEAIEQLAAVENGFNFRFESRWLSGALQTRFLTSYPVSGAPTTIVFDGQITSMKVSMDATTMATNVDAIGTQDASGDVLLASVSDPAMLAVYPQYDAVVPASDVSVLTTLDEHARRRLARGHAPTVIPSIEVDPSQVPIVGTYQCGDAVRVRGGYGLAAVDGLYTITSYAVDVDDAGGEKGKIAFANEEVFG